MEEKQREVREAGGFFFLWGHSARRCDCRADGNLSWVDASAIRLLFLVFPGAIHLVVFNPDEMRMQFRRDAADQRDYFAFLSRCILQLVANHRLVMEAF